MQAFSLALANAWGEVSLVVFTTLAPAATVACLIAAFPLLTASLAPEERYRLTKAFSVPLVTASVGLIAAATHLGNPSNALYVFAGVGRSPLSNEVVSAILFLCCAGVFWMTSFSARPHLALQRTLYGLCAVLGLAFVVAVAYAYDVETIVTWRLPTAPLSICLNALLGGPLLGMLTLHVSQWRPRTNRGGKVMLGVAAVALVANGVNYAVQGALLRGMGNYVALVPQVVPSYALGLLAFVLLAVAGVVLAARTLPTVGQGHVKSMVAANVLVLAGIFIMRFVFYLSHLTVGLGL